ncbi:MAG: transglutaminase domain-containing protein, partial [Candidatus Marinimicrobia bacterium]|nr:transglutaminase domain-containing protein [Candidatus Neomarinimicrobiota bacterium]
MRQATLTAEILFMLIIFTGLFSCSKKPSYMEMVLNGEFSEARQLIRQDLSMNDFLSPSLRTGLELHLVRMDRIEKDFTLTEPEVIDYVKQYIPNVRSEDLRQWEETNSLEYKIIDGRKWYFKYAQYNLFRLDPELKALKKKIDNEQGVSSGEKEFPLDKHIASIITEAKESGEKFVKPIKLRIKQSLIVDENMVPEGKTIRCWIPFPREINNRQTNIEILATDPANYHLADTTNLQRTIYFEKPSNGSAKTEFSVEYTYTAHGVYVPIDPDKVVPIVQRADLKPYLTERAYHIEFSNCLRKLSESIVGDEKNPYRIAQKLFAWVDTNITWASAREYSTFYNIPEYVIEKRHGDCGMQTITFMTLCRMNGI